MTRARNGSHVMTDYYHSSKLSKQPSRLLAEKVLTIVESQN
ncbi:hypothetical protein QT319_04420 [Escherichia coli]|nr:hypothetical protein [Escherichia coli]